MCIVVKHINIFKCKKYNANWYLQRLDLDQSLDRNGEADIR